MIGMRRALALVTVVCGLWTHLVDAQTARDYFNELYKAGGLDRMADEYVCFDDSKELQTFFIVAKSDVLKDFLVSNGQFAKLPKAHQAQLNKGFLILRGYDKGVAVGEEETYSKEGDTWLSDVFPIGSQRTPMRIRVSVTWETLRYKRSVEILDAQHELQSQVARYGKCEEISPGVQQKGN